MDKYLIRKNFKIFDDFEKFSNTECIPSYEKYKDNAYDYNSILKSCLPFNSKIQYVMKYKNIGNENKTFNFDFNNDTIYISEIYYYTNKTDKNLTFTFDLTYDDNSVETKKYNHGGFGKAKNKILYFNNKFIKNVSITVKSTQDINIKRFYFTYFKKSNFTFLKNKKESSDDATAKKESSDDATAKKESSDEATAKNESSDEATDKNESSDDATDKNESSDDANDKNESSDEANVKKEDKQEDKLKLQIDEYLESLKMQFILNNYFTSKFEKTRQKFLTKKEDEKFYLIMIKTDKIEEKLQVKIKDKKAILVSPKKLSLTSGYVIILYFLVLISVILIFILVNK